MNRMKKYCYVDMSMIYKAVAAVGLLFLITLSFYLQGDEETSLLTVILFPVLLIVCLFVMYYGPSKRFKESMAYLEQRGLSQLVVSDFQISVPQMGDKLRVGKYFLFGKETGVIVPYDALISIKQCENKTKYVDVGTSNVKRTSFHRYIEIEWGDKKEHLCELDKRYDAEWNTFVNFLNIKAPNVNAVREIAFWEHNQQDYSSDDD